MHSPPFSVRGTRIPSEFGLVSIIYESFSILCAEHKNCIRDRLRIDCFVRERNPNVSRHGLFDLQNAKHRQYQSSSQTQWNISALWGAQPSGCALTGNRFNTLHAPQFSALSVFQQRMQHSEHVFEIMWKISSAFQSICTEGLLQITSRCSVILNLNNILPHVCIWMPHVTPRNCTTLGLYFNSFWRICRFEMIERLVISSLQGTHATASYTVPTLIRHCCSANSSIFVCISSIVTR